MTAGHYVDGRLPSCASVLMYFDHALTDAELAMLNQWSRREITGEFTVDHIAPEFWAEIERVRAEEAAREKV